VTAAPASPLLSLKDLAADAIRQRIFSGDLPPGSKVDQDALAAELGMSKLPIREALISLDSEGLINNVARRGAFVAPLTRDDVRDHYEIFGRVAGLAAERAATALTDEELEELMRLLKQMDATTDPDQLEQLNHDFHRHINLAGQSRRLAAVLGLLSKSLPSHFYEFHTHWADTARKDHRRILRALKARDPEAAGQAMADHLRRSADHAVAYLESTGFWDARV
jgi:DNA-binding GntR family transcriptional regulator